MDPFLGEIRIVPFNFAPTGWALCNGQLLSIAQNTALFSLLGTQFGGDGKSTFALPDLQASVPMDYGNGVGLSQRDIGEVGGAVGVDLTTNQLGPHTHPLNGTTATAASIMPASNVVYGAPPASARQHSYLYKSGAVTTGVAFDPSVIGPTGGSQAHNNMQPYLVLSFVIAMQGIYPARS